MKINTNMQEQINILTKQVESLTQELNNLKSAFSFQGTNFEELIRDAVFFDSNPQGQLSSTTVVTGVNFGTQTTTTAVVQTGTVAKFLKIYFRGQVYQIACYAV